MLPSRSGVMPRVLQTTSRPRLLTISGQRGATLAATAASSACTVTAKCATAPAVVAEPLDRVGPPVVGGAVNNRLDVGVSASRLGRTHPAGTACGETLAGSAEDLDGGRSRCRSRTWWSGRRGRARTSREGSGEPPQGLAAPGKPVHRRSAGRWLISLNITTAGGSPVRCSMRVRAALALSSPNQRAGGASIACRISHAMG